MKRDYTQNRKPRARSKQERTLDVRAAEVLANAHRITANAIRRGWIKRPTTMQEVAP